MLALNATTNSLVSTVPTTLRGSIRRAIEDLPAFPPDTAQAVLHIILSHHGSLEHGSPVVPCTREATLVHHIDNLGGRLGSFERLEKELAPGQSWTAFDRGIGSSAYFGPAVVAPMEGTVVKVVVEEGQAVDAGALVAVLEAMKMEQPLRAHKAGTVVGLDAEVGARVQAGTVVCRIEG